MYCKQYTCLRKYNLIPDAFQKTINNFGKINIVINNAGIMTKYMNMWEQAIDLNFVSLNNKLIKIKIL